MKKQLLFLLAMILAFAGTAYADFYTWEDESGATHITDYPPPQNQKNQKMKIYKQDAATLGEQQPPKEEKKPDITLYTKNDCPDCDKARAFLNSKNLTFTEINMDNDQTAAAKRKELDDSSDVPFAVISRAQVYGFSEAVYNRALKSLP